MNSRITRFRRPASRRPLQVSTFTRPLVRLQPGWRYANDGMSVVFTGAAEATGPANGSPATIQWYRNGATLGTATPLPTNGQFQLVIDRASFQPTDAYYFVVQAACCDNLSESAAQCDLLYGDTNCDGFVTIADIGSFVTLLTTQQPAPGCFPDNGDCNDDGFVTVADIGPFVLLLTADER